MKNYHGKKIQVDITEYVPDQTDSQRGYFHAMCKVLGDEAGELQADVKLAVKKKLWGTDIHNIGGIEVEVFKSMAKGKTNKLDYSDAIEALLIMAAEAGVYLPEPNI